MHLPSELERTSQLVRDGRYSGRGVGVHPPPRKAGLIFSPRWNVGLKVAIATLCVLCAEHNFGGCHYVYVLYTTQIGLPQVLYD